MFEIKNIVFTNYKSDEKQAFLKAFVRFFNY